MRIALAGNPNSGKTTMFNALTGKNEKVGNWAGVTVDKKEYPIRRALTAGERIIAVDLPGAYSMSPFTAEESITQDYVNNEHPDVIINIVDSINLSRSLFFTTQLLELGVPVVVALNKTDVNERKGNVIDTEALSRRLGCPVIQTVSTKSRGIKELVKCAVALVGGKQTAPYRDEAAPEDRIGAEMADRARFDFVNGVVAEVEVKKTLTKTINRQDKIDDILTNKWVGLPIFACVMFLVLWISQYGPAVWLADWLSGLLESGQEALYEAIGSDSVWSSILIDGIIGGFIAIIGFLPLVMVMYFLIALLEDCGYMARATVVLDPLFKRVGLSGKAVIPFVIGVGCAIPGVMASRTIRNERERRSAAMLAPFMPCGAKLPVIALFAGAFFGKGRWIIGPLMYFLGIAIIFLGAMLVNMLNGRRNGRSYFIMELPEYKIPSLGKAAVSMLQRGWAYIVKAGTIILLCNFTVHLMQNFNWRFQAVGEDGASGSILATVATPIAFIVAPIIGRVAWQFAAAAVTGFIAKENVVGTLAVCFSIANLFNLDELAMNENAAGAVAETFGLTPVGAIAFLMFNLFSPPCFAAIGAMRSEIKSRGWFLAGIGLQLSVGYTIAFLTFFFGTLITGGDLGPLWAPILGWAIVAAIVATFTVAVVKKRVKPSIPTEKITENV